ncbi:hypothetical protein L6Q96_14430 [Candidatus Binatia bacterium]|nr:hypothetical protein [Candidatus Binatia bacterium]
MKRPRSLFLLALLLLGGCAADGGPVGTGIAAISGNVVAVDTATDGATAESGLATALPFPVTVSIDEAPGIADTTDAEGNFELRGEFSGALTLRFRGDGIDATTPIDIPAGSVLVLEDVTLRRQSVEPANVRQLEFLGRIVMVDCVDDANGVLLVDDRAPGRNQFLVRISADTEITRRGGRPLACTALRVGDEVGIQGEVRLRTDRTIDALAIVVAPKNPPPDPGPVQPVRFTGTVVAADCTAEVLLLASVNGGTRVRLVPTTRYFTPDGHGGRRPIACTDLAPRGHVEGNGTVRLNNPGAIVAETIVFRPATRG